MGAGTNFDRYRIAARMERLPISRWHTKIRLIIGTVNFCDAFDALAIAYVLPVLIPLWHMTSGEIGAMISIGYVGQIFGGITSGWLAERYGRVPVAAGNIILFSSMSIACIFVHTYPMLLAARCLQGVGLGGEVPVINTYNNELAPTNMRGRYVIVQQLMFSVGLAGVALAGIFIVPMFGWQWMFVLGGLPVLLGFTMIRSLPESPRWLASRGRDEDADRVLRRIENLVSRGGARPLPPIPTNIAPAVAATSRFTDLFRGIYLKRTLSLWVLWFCTYLIFYGVMGWFPSIMRTVYHASVTESNVNGFLLTLVGFISLLFAALTIDKLGRKRVFTWSFVASAVPFFVVAFVPNLGSSAVVILTMFAVLLSNTIPGSLGMYTAENYPNHLRAIGSGASGIPQRLSSIVGPLLIGMLLPLYGIAGVFGMLGVFSVIGCVACAVFSIETSGKTLEELSPPTKPAVAAANVAAE